MTGIDVSGNDGGTGEFECQRVSCNNGINTTIIITNFSQQYSLTILFRFIPYTQAKQ